ncbi:MAG: aspartate-semialdehyde dehydrogenase [Defluviitaleaceae bacterium]|nr:aspartate-semialdehyde dehydrogenase [Defluviitaleaceae bacterium]
MKKINLAVVGATGMVGRTVLKVLEERAVPIENFYAFSSKRSAGCSLEFCGKEYLAAELTENSFNKGIDIAIFCAGGEISEKFAPIAAAKGCIVVDNSSHFRMHEGVPLIVPEVNPEDIKRHKGIIANPNCSTIQAMVVLKPLLDRYGLKRVIYSTYQSVSGAGLGGWQDLENGTNNTFSRPIAYNLIPQIDAFLENGYTKEEMKMIKESRKILGLKDLKVTATTVRVPVFSSHSESINIELNSPFNVEDVKALFRSSKGVVLMDDVDNNIFPTPLDAAGKDEVFAGRIRRDESVENGLNLFCVADNLRKGAATNAVQIVELLLKEGEI